jgi:DNA-binding CsgD family transcriptional regulator/tetratricopeptide (TPR) repeat protein
LTLVGRDRELHELREQWNAAVSGEGRLVLTGGEAGIGKTALVEALGRHAEAQGALVLTGRCYDLTQTPPYGPWIGLFDQYRRADLQPSPPSAFSQRGTLGAVTSKADLFREVSEFFATAAAERPLMLVLEDLHWSDLASLDLLRDLAHDLAGQAILLVATYRADELTRQNPLYALLPLLVSEARATRLALRRLEAHDVLALVATRFRLPAPDSVRLADYLVHRADGNPLFLGELLRTLAEERVLRSEAARDTLADLTDVRIPLLLRQVIDGRLARLDSAAHGLLAVAAVIGQEVPLDLWAEIAGVDEESLAATLETTIQARLLEEQTEGTRTRFVHALIREALYDSILPSRRRRLHRAIGEVLAAQPDPEPDAVAHHFQMAEDERALQWLIRAGDRAQRAYAFVAAGDRFESALAFLERNDTPVGERGWLLWRLGRVRRFSDPRQSIALFDEALIFAKQVRDQILIGNVYLDRGSLIHQLGHGRLGLRDMETGVSTLQQLTPADQLRLWNLPPILEVADTLVAEATFAHALSIAGRFIEAKTHGEFVFKVVPSTSLPDAKRDIILSETYLSAGRANAAMGLPEQARGAFERAGELYAVIGHHMLVGATRLTELDQVLIPYCADRVSERRRIAAEADSAYAKANTAAPDQPSRIAGVLLLILEGEWAAARQVLDAMPRPFEPFPSVLRATIALHQGDIELGWQLVRETFPEGPETLPGDNDFVQFNRMQYIAAVLALETGDLVTAREWITAYDDWLAWSGAVLGLADSQILWARYYRKARNAEEANVCAQRASAVARAPRQPLALLAAQRLLGELATDAGQFVDAAHHLAEALRLADTCIARHERCLSLLALAELQLARRQTSDAALLLDEVRAICTPLGARFALTRAEALDARLAEMGAAEPIYPAGLSVREVEVLRLVAAGHTNRDIADTLFLSEHTVRSHVRSILTKTQTENRTAAALFAHEHNLI